MIDTWKIKNDAVILIKQDQALLTHFPIFTYLSEVMYHINKTDDIWIFSLLASSIKIFVRATDLEEVW